jgi:hypothetical protein
VTTVATGADASYGLRMTPADLAPFPFLHGAHDALPNPSALAALPIEVIHDDYGGVEEIERCGSAIASGRFGPNALVEQTTRLLNSTRARTNDEDLRSNHLRAPDTVMRMRFDRTHLCMLRS